MDLFRMEDTAVSGHGPKEASTDVGGAQPTEGRAPAQRAGMPAGKERKKVSKKEVGILHVRVREPVLEAIEEAVRQSPIEFANASEFVRCAVEAELRRRGLVKTYK